MPDSVPKRPVASSLGKKPKVAVFFRYGAEEHVTFLPPLPELVKKLGKSFEVHHFGMRSPLPRPGALPPSLIIHHLPLFTVRRQNTFDKFLKAGIWLLVLPWLGLYCRIRKFRALFVDESVPLTALILRLSFGERIAFTVHDFFTEIYFDPNPALRPIGRLLRWVDHFSWRHLGLLLTRVQKTRTYLIASGVKPERVAIVGDAGDLGLFKPGDRIAARLKMGFTDDVVVLIHHGILHPNKGNDRIIRAMADLRDHLPSLHFYCLGDGPELETLRALVKELGLEQRVTLPGWVENIESVVTALQASDIGLAMRVGNPSDHFHLTSTLVHNMACGLPILAARLGGFQEVLVDGQNSLLFDPDNPKELQEALVRLVQSPSLRNQLSQAAYTTALERFDTRTVGAQLAVHIQKLAESQD